jgi:hypothetical protein
MAQSCFMKPTAGATVTYGIIDAKPDGPGDGRSISAA